MSDDSELRMSTHESGFERDHYASAGREHPAYEIEIDFNASGESVTALVENAEARAAELAEGREHYVWRILADEDSTGFTAECCMYVYVPRTSTMRSRTAEQLRPASADGDRHGRPPDVVRPVEEQETNQ